MIRMTTDSPTGNIQVAWNLFYAKDGEVWVRAGGPAPEFPDVTLCNYVRNLVKQHIPGEELPGDDYELDALMAEWLMDGTDTLEGVLATLHTAGWGFAELRHKLKAYEDTGLKPSICAEYKKFEDEAVAKGVPFSRIIELMEAEKNGHLRVLPAALGETVYYADEDAGRVMMGYINGYQIRHNGTMSFEFFNLELDVEWHSIGLPLEEFGKTVFLKEEEAKKVLGGAEDVT